MAQTQIKLHQTHTYSMCIVVLQTHTSTATYMHEVHIAQCR